MTDADHRFRILLIGVRSDDFDIVGALDRVEALFRRLVPSVAVKRCFGRSAGTRTGMLEALDEWVSDTRGSDICVLYYFGHGGRVRFSKLGGGVSERVIPYLSCEPGGGEFTGILDFALSARVTELDRRCGNVTTIIDACFSGTVVRAEDGRLRAEDWVTVLDIEAPGWVIDLFDSGAELQLAADSHPRVVRLAGASPRHQAFLTDSAEYAEMREGPSVGMFTRALVETLEAAGDDWGRLSWDSVAHAVRQRVITAFAMEGQWIALAGPRERLLFSTHRARTPWTVAYLETASGHWIRAGAIQGVEVGDRWALVDPLVDRDARHVPLVEAVVEAVELNRAKLALVGSSPTTSLPPVAAAPVAISRRMPVAVDPRIDLSLHGSVWLTLGGPESRAHVHLIRGELELVDARGEWVRVRVEDDPEGRGQLIELIEDRARTLRLLDAQRELATRTHASVPVTWAAGCGDEELEANATLSCEDQLWVRLRNPVKDGNHWFVSVVLVDVLGRPWLLNASQPDGVELEPDDLEYIGRRLGATNTGFTLDWPANAERTRVGRVELLFLASDRPLQLGHLVRPAPSSEIAAFRLQGLELARRGELGAPLHSVPEVGSHWSCGRMMLNLLSPSNEASEGTHGHDQTRR